jgi:hypothetical protein
VKNIRAIDNIISSLTMIASEERAVKQVEVRY